MPRNRFLRHLGRPCRSLIGRGTDTDPLEMGPVYGFGGSATAPLFIQNDGSALAGVNVAGQPFYRQPHLTLTNAGTLLADMTGMSTSNDVDGKWLMFKRSSDGGRTWGSPYVIYTEASPSDHGIGSGQSIALPNGNILGAFYRGSKSGANWTSLDQLFKIVSTDDGLTFTPTEITNDVTILSNKFNKAITAIADAGGGTVDVTAASHGMANNYKVRITGTTDYNGDYLISSVTANTFRITHAFTSSQTGTVKAIGQWRTVFGGCLLRSGRVCFAGYYRYLADGSGDAYPYSFYSDDNGGTWAVGLLDETVAGNVGAIEPVCVETNTNNELYFSCRNRVGAYHMYALSSDGGATIGNVILDDGTGGRTKIFQANGAGGVPTDVHRVGTKFYMAIANHAQQRTRMTVFESVDDCRTWPKRRVIDYGGSAYPGMEVVNGTLVLIWERGFSGAASFDGWANKVSLARFKPAAISNLAGVKDSFRWRLNEFAASHKSIIAGESIQDSGQWDQHWKPQGTPLYTDDGAGNYGLVFDAASKYVIAAPANHTTIDGGVSGPDEAIDGSFTVEVELTANSTTGVIVGGPTTGARWTLDITGTPGKARFLISDGTASPSLTGAITVNDNVKHRIVAIRDVALDQLRLYVDGVADGTTTDTTTATINPASPVQKRVTQFNTGATNLACTIWDFRFTHGVVMPALFITSPVVDPNPVDWPAAPAGSPGSISGLVFWACCTHSNFGFCPEAGCADRAPWPIPDYYPCGSTIDAGPTRYIGNTFTKSRGFNWFSDSIGKWWRSTATTNTSGPDFTVIDGESLGNFLTDSTIGTGVFTLSARIRPRAGHGSSNAIIASNAASSGNTGFGWWIEATPKQRIFITKVGTTLLDGVPSSGSTVADGSAYHVCCYGRGYATTCGFRTTLLTGSGPTTIASEVLTGTYASPGGSFSGSLPLILGNLTSSGSSAFNGDIADLCLFNRQLDPTELQTLCDWRG